MDPIICPAILSSDAKNFRLQIERVVSFASRIQIDLSDGKFAPHQTIAPAEAWWPVGMTADIHLMFDSPTQAAELILPHKPNLIIVHAESKADPKAIYSMCKSVGVKLGVALLPDTPVDAVKEWLPLVSHAMIFSGSLGQFGGHADISQLTKVAQLRLLNPNLEIGWDGGINDQNVATLVAGGIDVLNVGGFIQHSANPAQTFQALQRIADETGTT